jgi:prophage DNA circulation protein
MATQVFDTLQRASFAGYEFAVSHLDVTGGLRDHVHEYPHSPGGAPEKLGRRLYEFHYTIPLYQGQPRYPKAFPETMQSLLIVFEGGKTFDLVVPILGTISAYCTSWRVVVDPKAARNGVTLEATFREDQSNLFLVTELVAQTASGFSAALADYNQALADQISRLEDAEALIDAPDPVLLLQIPPADLSLFYAIATAASILLDEIADADTYGAAVAGLADDVVTLCLNADATCSSLNDCTAYPLLYALQGVWSQAQQIANDALQTGITVVEYTVPEPGQSVTVISTAIYGDSSHAIELMQTNPIEDPFRVPPGTVLKAYLFATTSAAA